MDKRDYDKEIEALVFERDSRIMSESLAGKLAILIHDHSCGYNHTDGCGWMYEMKNGLHDWNHGEAHYPYLEKARKAIEESETLRTIK
jgi:hypothetical protein